MKIEYKTIKDPKVINPTYGVRTTDWVSVVLKVCVIIACALLVL